jgi:hypothetical protein
MYPAAVLVGFGVIDILFKKNLYTPAFHLRGSLFVIFATLMLMIIAILYDVIVRKQDYVLSISSLVG